MTKHNIAIIGDGNVGQALGRGVTRAGHTAKIVGNDAQATRDAVAWADLTLLAVPFGLLAVLVLV